MAMTEEPASSVPRSPGSREAEPGILGDAEVADLGAEFAKAALRQLPVPCPERPSKLLVTPFEEGVIPATRLQMIEVFRHAVEHHSSDLVC